MGDGAVELSFELKSVSGCRGRALFSLSTTPPFFFRACFSESRENKSSNQSSIYPGTNESSPLPSASRRACVSSTSPHVHLCTTTAPANPASLIV